MASNTVLYNSDSLLGVRGSEFQASETKMSTQNPLMEEFPVPSTPPVKEEKGINLEAWKKLTALANNDSIPPDPKVDLEEMVPGSSRDLGATAVATGKSPRKNVLGRSGGDPVAQPPSKKECLSSEPMTGGSPPDNQACVAATPGSAFSQRSMQGALTMGTQMAASPRQVPITKEALFGSGMVKSPQNFGSPQLNQNQLILQLLEQQQTMQWMQLHQLQAAAALNISPLALQNSSATPAMCLELTRNLTETLQRNLNVPVMNTLGASGGLTSTPKTSTPKVPGGKYNGSGGGSGRSNSSGYITSDSSFNTSAENSLHELVSKIALQGPNHGITDLGSSGSPGSGFSAEGAAGSLDLIRDARWTNQSYIEPNSSFSNGNVDQLAENHRKSAASSEATCTWVGQLPPKNTKNPQYSCKVFLGGVPWDITEQMLQIQFKQFGPVTVDWPGKEKNHGKNPPSGYVYLIFENEKAIRALLGSCTSDYSNGQNGEYYFKLSSKRTRSKEVQVIPWAVNDSNFSRVPQGSRTETQRTVFVGALHGMLNAEALANIMNDLFGGVTFAGIDTDKYKYPIGSGRVAFNNDRSYMKAVSAGFIEIKANKFSKKVQVDPYLDDHLCSQCAQVQGQYFCREVSCFTYYCLPCWNWHHSIEAYKPHVPLTRNSKMKSSNMPPVTPVSHMPQTQFGIQFSAQPPPHARAGHGSTMDNSANDSLHSFAPFAPSLAHGNAFPDSLGGIQSLLNLPSLSTQQGPSGAANSLSCAGAAAGLFALDTTSVSAIEARN